MSIDTLISRLLALKSSGVPGTATAYVPEKTNLNGAGWCSPRRVETGFDPHPLSAANDGTQVVFIQ